MLRTSRLNKKLLTFLAIAIFLIASGLYATGDGFAVTNCQKQTLSSLTDNKITTIKDDPSRINSIFESCKDELRADLGSSFSDLNNDELFCVFSCLVAYRLAPYGKSKTLDFNQILHEPALACDKYVIAVGGFCEYRKMENISLSFVGWNGGAVGNHAQMFVVNSKGGTNLLLDPTIALVAKANFNQVASGKPIDGKSIIDFSTRSELASFRTKVVKALFNGEYKPSDFMYYFESLDLYLKGSITSPDDWPPSWPTPGAMLIREKYKSS